MGKPELVQLYRDLHPHGWTANPVSAWRKDEIINEIIYKEIGPRVLCGHPEPSGSLLCSIGAFTIHGIHRYEIDKDTAEPAEPADQPVNTWVRWERQDAPEGPWALVTRGPMTAGAADDLMGELVADKGARRIRSMNYDPNAPAPGMADLVELAESMGKRANG